MEEEVKNKKEKKVVTKENYEDNKRIKELEDSLEEMSANYKMHYIKLHVDEHIYL